MGYSTEFSGALILNKQLTPEQKNYINLFSGTRRMKRDVIKLMQLYNGKFGYPISESNSLPNGSNELVSDMYLNPTTQTYEVLNIELAEKIYGKDGEFFAMDDGNKGQNGDASIIDYNCPPNQLTGGSDKWDENRKRINNGECQPSLWCQWVINDENQLVWDGCEKFYEYVIWLKYLIKNFFQSWGVLLNGSIEWKGEDSNDRGIIIVTDNEVSVEEY